MSLIARFFKNIFGDIDWILIGSILPIVGFGLITMNSFVDTGNFFYRQTMWLVISLIVFLILSNIDFKFLRRTQVIVWLYLIVVFLLLSLFAVGSTYQGAQSWFSIGGFTFQPAEISKLVLILLLAKYFSRRHVEIKNFRHIIVSGVYAFIIFALVALQPDFGSALIIFMIWLGMILVSGISYKHLLTVFIAGSMAFLVLWGFAFQDYQKARIKTFLNPLSDIQGTGYNAFQSTVAVGSGQLLGKGIGYGTQSRLEFLPEYETDFIFAAFSEEWGFVGVLIFLSLYMVFIWRILINSMNGFTNFEILFGVGLAILYMSHLIIHIGMNIGLLPVTGLTLPFMSYGGTSLMLAFAGIGILMGMKKYNRTIHKDLSDNEFVGI
ncbi:rod shape-determining protein RodA [Candidatus Parcubacteria bacterium]|nr:rod shape-determining protein RodA [Candidatus Parcubacteria bacterium]